jgi:hypothetical protein
MSNSYRVFTVTRNKGLRVVAGATFKMSRLADGRHFIKPKDNSQDGVVIDVSLLHSPFATVSHLSRQSADDRSAAYSQCEITLSRFGLAQDNEGKTVLVPPVESDAPYVQGLTGACSPVVIWCPEAEMRAVYTGDKPRDQCWLMPGLVRLLVMSGLWFDWYDPAERLRGPSSIKIETSGGEVTVSESDRLGSDRAVKSDLKPFNAERSAYRLPRPVESDHGVMVY